MPRRLSAAARSKLRHVWVEWTTCPACGWDAPPGLEGRRGVGTRYGSAEAKVLLTAAPGAAPGASTQAAPRAGTVMPAPAPATRQAGADGQAAAAWRSLRRSVHAAVRRCRATSDRRDAPTLAGPGACRSHAPEVAMHAECRELLPAVVPAWSAPGRPRYLTTNHPAPTTMPTCGQAGHGVPAADTPEPSPLCSRWSPAGRGRGCASRQQPRPGAPRVPAPRRRSAARAAPSPGLPASRPTLWRARFT